MRRFRLRGKVKMETVMGLLLLAAAFLLSTGGAKQAALQAGSAGQVVVIDAGHGGDDPGKVGINGSLESEVNLAISQKLKACLEKEGVTVVMTREDSDGLYSPDAANKKQDDMKNRCAKIDGATPVFTVSIHQNSYTEESVCGPQVFYYTHSEQAGELAAYIQEAMNQRLGVERPREIKANDTYYLLKKTKSPTVIVECGFLSNRAEAAKLVTEEYQQQVAEAVCEGVLGYLKQEIQ